MLNSLIQKHHPRNKSRFACSCGIVGILFLSTFLGCGYMGYKKIKWDAKDKALMGGVVITSGFDAWTTMEGMDRGYKELNPILGNHPSDGAIIAHSLTIVLLGYYFAQYMHPTERKIFLTFLSLIKGGAAVHNWRLLND